MARNDDAAQRLYESVTSARFPVFTQNKDVTKKVFKEITPVIEKDDYLTIENIIADPDGKRISSLLALDVTLQACSLKHPLVKDENTTTLFGVENAMAIPIDNIVEVPFSEKDLEVALRNQIRFGFDPVTEILKNCCTSHTVIHSVLRGALQTLYDKTMEWGMKQLEERGQEMSLCAVLNAVSEVGAIVKEAKEATGRMHVRLKKEISRNVHCKDRGCQSGGHIIQPFLNSTNAKYEDVTAATTQATIQSNSCCDLPCEFLVKGGRKKHPPHRLAVNNPSFTSSLSARASSWAAERVNQKVRKLRLETGVKLIMDRLRKRSVEEGEGETSPLQPPFDAAGDQNKDEILDEVRAETALKAPMISPIVSPVGSPLTHGLISLDAAKPENSGLPPVTEAEPMDIAVAPTAEQVQKNAPDAVVLESTGQAPGSGWMRLRESTNNQSIANYASRGSGINTGQYRNFNTVL